MSGYEHRLQSLYDLGHQVVDNLGLGHQALRQALKGLLPLVDARGGALFLWEDGTPSLSQQVGLTPAEEAGLVRQVSLEGPLAQVVREGVPLRLDRWSPDGGEAEDQPALLGVPLAAGPRLLGAFYLIGRRSVKTADQSPAFAPEDEALVRTFALTLALALENARLQEQNRANFLQKALLYEMTTTISATLDIGQVLRMVSERLARLMEVAGARICILEPGHPPTRATVVAAFWTEESERQSANVGQTYDLSQRPVTTRALTSRRPLLITADQGGGEWQEELVAHQAQALLLIPLVARNRTIGYVEMWETRPDCHFGEDQITLIQTLANQAAVAIENARLFAEAQQRLSELTLLYDIVVAAAATMELETMLQSVVNTLRFVLEGTHVAVLLLDGKDNEATGADDGQGGKPCLRVRAYAGHPPAQAIQAGLRPGEGVIGRVAETGEPVLIPDVRQDGGYITSAPTTRSALSIPLAAGRRVIGVLNVESSEVGGFSDDDLRLLQTMGNSLAVILENTQLFERLRRSEEALALRNQALEEANARLKELDRLKSQFLASVSHELRTPLNAIIGFSEVLLDGLAGELSEMAQEYLRYIHASGQHLLALINDLLDLSKIQAGRMTLSLQEVDIPALLEEVQATIAPMVEQKAQTLIFEVADPLPPLMADPMRLKQILLNLLSNASKFTPERGRIDLVCSLTDDGRMMRFIVTDNGIGIPPEEQAMIFEEFRQARQARELGQGTGLGLAITRRLVELHGGSIGVESEGIPGRGSRFTVLLPLAGPEKDGNT